MNTYDHKSNARFIRVVVLFAALLFCACAFALPAAFSDDVAFASSTPTWAEAASPFAGAGTEESPYEIGTAADLVALSDLVNGGYYRKGTTKDDLYSTLCYVLTDDIDLSETAFVPIGNGGAVTAYVNVNPFLEDAHAFDLVWESPTFTSSIYLRMPDGSYAATGTLDPADYPDVFDYAYYYLYDFEKAFFGVFDGNGHTISHLTATNLAADGGLFGYLVNARVANVTLSSETISTSQNAGGIAGKALASEIENASVKNAALTAGLFAGGIVGSVLPDRTYALTFGSEYDVSACYYACVGDPYPNDYTYLAAIDVTLSGTYAGGIVGGGEDFSVEKTFSSFSSSSATEGCILGSGVSATVDETFVLSLPVIASATSGTTESNVFYPSDALTYANGTGLSTEFLLHGDLSDALWGEYWTRAPFSRATDEGFYPSPTAEHCAFPAFEATFDGEHVAYLYAAVTPVNFSLSVLSEPTLDGYVFEGYSAFDALYDDTDALSLTSSVAVISAWSLAQPTSSAFSVSRTTTKQYDGISSVAASVSYLASSLSVTYLWERSADGVTYSPAGNATNELTLTHVADSGYYRCVATIHAGDVLLVGDDEASVTLASDRYSVTAKPLTITATFTLAGEDSVVYDGEAFLCDRGFLLSEPFLAGDYEDGDVTLALTKGGASVTSVRSVGSYVLTPVCEKSDYALTLVPAEYTVLPAALVYTATGYDGSFDGNAHCVTVTASSVDGSETTILYSVDDVVYGTDNPAFSSSGTHDVYYRIEASNHETVRGLVSVSLAQLAVTPVKNDAHPALVKPYDTRTVFPVNAITTDYYSVPLAGAFASDVRPVSAVASSARPSAVTVTVTFASVNDDLVLTENVLVYDALIEPATVTITPVASVEATYNGTLLFTESLTPAHYLVTTNTGVTPTYRLSAAYASAKDVSPANDVLHAVFLLTGTYFRFENGTASTTVDFAFTLSPLPVSFDTAYVAALDRAYDGTVNVTVETYEGCLGGVLEGDSPALLVGGATIPSPDASETPYAVTVSGVALSDANYLLPEGLDEIFSSVLTMTVSKADPVVVVSLGADFLYESATRADLPSLTVTGGTAGSVVWQYVVEDGGAIDWSRYLLAEGVAQFRYDFTPADTTNYNAWSGYETLLVVPVAPDHMVVTYLGPLSYEALTPLDRTELTVVVVNNDGSEKVVPYGTHGYNLLYQTESSAFSGEDTHVGVLYSEGGADFYDEIAVTVTKLELTVPYVSTVFTYNGRAQAVTPAYFRRALMSISGDVATHAGDYECAIALTPAAARDYVFVGGAYETVVAWSILPLPKYEPFLGQSAFVYDGSVVTPVLRNDFNADASFYEVSGDLSATEAGDYVVVISLVSDDYVWVGGSSANLRLSWTIARRSVPIPEIFDLPFIFDGAYHDVLVTENDAYSLRGDLRYLAAGSYRIYAELSDTNDYVWADGSSERVTLTYEVAKQKVVKPVFGTSYRFTGNAYFVPLSSTPYYAVTGDLRATDAGSYVVRAALKDKTSYVWADDTEDDLVMEWSILPMPVKAPSLGGTLGYTGAAQTALVVYDVIACNIRGDVATEVGSYEAIVSLKSKQNTYWADGTTDDKVVPYEIVPQRVVIPSSPASVFYTGEPQTAEIDRDDAYSVSGDVRTEVGVYEIRLSLLDPQNYVWTDGTVTDKLLSFSVRSLSVVGDDARETLTDYVLGSTLYSPARKGYFFLGWYLTEDYSGDPVTSLDEVTDDTVLYAKWVEISSTEPIVTEPEKVSPLSQKAIIGIGVAGGALVIAALILIFGLVFKRGGGRRSRGRRDSTIM